MGRNGSQRISDHFQSVHTRYQTFRPVYTLAPNPPNPTLDILPVLYEVKSESLELHHLLPTSGEQP